MRQIKVSKAMLIGGAWCEVDQVVEVDDHRARQLVELKHAVFVSTIAMTVPVQRATARVAGEKATAR